MQTDLVFTGTIKKNGKIIDDNALLYQLGPHGYYSPKMHRVINDTVNDINILYVDDLELFNYQKLQAKGSALKITIRRYFQKYLKEAVKVSDLYVGDILACSNIDGQIAYKELRTGSLLKKVGDLYYAADYDGPLQDIPSYNNKEAFVTNLRKYEEENLKSLRYVPWSEVVLKYSIR